jgi:hypothetical protein
MTTREPEIFAPVDLCTRDGRRLNPDASGWSRSLLHRANLAGRWGRNKRWDYWAIQSEDIIVALTVADIDYLGLVTVDWIEPRTHRTGGHSAMVPLARGIDLPDRPTTGRLEYRGSGIGVAIAYPPGATELVAYWQEKGGGWSHLTAVVDEPAGHESLNVVIPWSETLFQFTSKHQARPAAGTLTVEGRASTFGGSAGEAWGILDVGRGRWPYQTRWNWGGGAGLATTGERVGIQIGGKWTDETGFTENGILVEGQLVKIGEDLEWVYNWDDPLEPWRVRSADRSLDLTLLPIHDRHTNTNLGVLYNEVHQVFGHWTGSVPSGSGRSLSVERILGFAEEARARW